MILDNQNNTNKSKFIDIPRGTLTSILILVGIFIFLQIINENIRLDIIMSFSFIPLLYSYKNFLSIYHLTSPITYILIHANITHLIFNITMLAAFGSGVERKYGIKVYLCILFLSSIISIFLHHIIYNDSNIPVIGSSGAITGLFSFSLIDILKKQKKSNLSIMTISIFFILLFFLFSLINIIPNIDSSEIAWIVHVGGFLTGAILFYILRIIKKK